MPSTTTRTSAPVEPERRHGRPLTAVLSCWSGPADEDDKIRGLLNGLGPVVGRFLERMPYPVINTLFDEMRPAGLYHYWKVETVTSAFPMDHDDSGNLYDRVIEFRNARLCWSQSVSANSVSAYAC